MDFLANHTSWIIIGSPKFNDIIDDYSRHIATADHTMASIKPLTMLVARSRPTARLSSSVRTFAPATIPLSALSTTIGLRAYATPSGPPPPGFRMKKPERWDQENEGVMDRAGKYFLLLEMMRGMYVVLEQYFRPPWVLPLSFRIPEKYPDMLQIHYLLPIREGIYLDLVTAMRRMLIAA